MPTRPSIGAPAVPTLPLTDEPLATLKSPIPAHLKGLAYDFSVSKH